MTLPEGEVVVGQTIYVPIASSVATADNARPINLAATVTIRNLDQGRPIVIRSARYHDSGGRLIRAEFDQPVEIGPLAALDLFIRESDNSGGSSPSFVVDWVSRFDVVAPLVESVMVSTAGSQGLMLRSEGRVIASHHR